MKKLIGMALAALFTVTAAESVSAQDYHKYEKKEFKHDYDRAPYGNAYGYRERVDVIQSRPYYGYRHHWDRDRDWDRNRNRTIIIDHHRDLDRDLNSGRYFYNGRWYYR